MNMLRKAEREGKPYHLVLIDKQIAGVGGIEIGREIKKDKELYHTILVMLTALGERGDAVKMQQIGFSAYLTRPVKPSLLYDCLRTILAMPSPAYGVPPSTIITRHTLAEDRKRRISILLAEGSMEEQEKALRLMEKLGYHTETVSDLSGVERR